MCELANIDSECTRCGVCMQQQSVEGMPALACGDLARELAAASAIDEVSPEGYEFLLSCSLCNACTVHCPEGISCAQTVKAGRKRLLELQPELAESYRAFRVDYQENLFTALRKAAGFAYEEYLEASDATNQLSNEATPESTLPAQTTQTNTPPSTVQPAQATEVGISLFFPGCSLSSYSETLTKATFDLLKELGVAQEMSVYCCGKPLGDIGAREAGKNYSNSFIAKLRERSVSRLIVACPNCFYTIKALFESQGVNDITVEALPVTLNAAGVSCPNSNLARIAIHDSCPDRFDLFFGIATRELLSSSGAEIVEMENNLIDTLCCGAGGLSQVKGFEQSSNRCVLRLRQFSETNANCLVCNCASCVNTFLAQGNAPATRHYLELLLDVTIDWQALLIAYDKMYIESQKMFTLPLSESTEVFDVKKNR